MATRKKSPARKKTPLREGGLLHPSRKQFDWEREKAGTNLAVEERRIGLTFGGNVSTPGATIYSVPLGKKAKLVRAWAKTTGSASQVVVGGQELFNLINTNDTERYESNYQDGINMSASQTLVVQVGGAAVTCYYSFVIIEEEASDGYITSTGE